jgi:hypothetical protein
MQLPSQDLRSNIGSWAVPSWAIPAAVHQMTDALPREQFDPSFMGQYLQTTYFDTRTMALRKARVPREEYLTLRLRSYSPSCPAGGTYPVPTFALSAKTEDQKFRIETNPAVAKLALTDPPLDLLAQLLPANLYARLLDIIGNDDLLPVVTCTASRFAVEDDTSRLTLDINPATDTGKKLPFSIMEFKSTHRNTTPPGSLPLPCMRPIKLSKFLWSTDWK